MRLLDGGLPRAALLPLRHLRHGFDRLDLYLWLRVDADEPAPVAALVSQSGATRHDARVSEPWMGLTSSTRVSEVGETFGMTRA